MRLHEMHQARKKFKINMFFHLNLKFQKVTVKNVRKVKHSRALLPLNKKIQSLLLFVTSMMI